MTVAVTIFIKFIPVNKNVVSMLNGINIILVLVLIIDIFFMLLMIKGKPFMIV